MVVIVILIIGYFIHAGKKNKAAAAAFNPYSAAVPNDRPMNQNVNYPNNNNGFNTFATEARRADAMSQQNVGYNPWAQNQPMPQPVAPAAPVNVQPQMNYGYNYGYGYGSQASNEYPVLSGAYQMPAGNPFEKKNGVNQWDAMYGTNQFVFTGTGVMNSQWPVPNQPQNVMPNYTFPQNAMPNFSQPNPATFSGPELSWTAQANASWATK
jgi:hypothetical protein